MMMPYYSMPPADTASTCLVDEIQYYDSDTSTDAVAIDFSILSETEAHLMSSPENARKIQEAIRQLDAGEGVKIDLDNLLSEHGISLSDED